jgi:predicted signal transduction protein with EAL and GGDEF domain
LEFNIAIVISTVLTVVFNSYVGVPLMHSQFGEWLRQERVVANEKGCSRILDTGLRVSGRIAVLLVWWSFALVTGSLGVIHPASSSSSS